MTRRAITSARHAPADGMPGRGARVERSKPRIHIRQPIRANLPSDRRHSRQRLSCAGDGPGGRIHLRHVRYRRRLPDDAASDLHRRAAGRGRGQRHDACGGIFVLRRDRLLAAQRHRRHSGADLAGRRHHRQRRRCRAVHLAARPGSARPGHRAVLRHASQHRRRLAGRRERPRDCPRPPRQAGRVAPARAAMSGSTGCR